MAAPLDLPGSESDDPTTETGLQEQARAQRTFDSVYAPNFDFVWRSLRRLGVAESHLDDALQDVFIVVHRRLSDFEERSSIRTWLFGISLRVAREYRRKKENRIRWTEVPESIGDPRPAPDEVTAQKQAVQLLDSILSTLDDQRREVFVMADVEQMSAPEIARLLDIKTSTVYSRLRSARQQFEQALAELKKQRS